MKLSHITKAVAAAVLAIGAVGSANALTITSGNYTFTIGNYDSGTTGYTRACTGETDCNGAATTPALGSRGSVNPSADTMGIFSVDRITTGGNVIFRAGGVDGFLTGVFGNLVDTNVSVANGTTTANATGGTFRLFQNATDYNPALTPTVVPGTKDLNAGLYPGISGGSLYLEGIFVPGVIAGDTTTTYQSIFANTSFAGNGAGFIELTGGSAQSIFDTDSIRDGNGDLRDLSLTANFQDTNREASQFLYTVVSGGTIQGAAGEVPEPGSLALLAMGGLVAGFAARRRKVAAK